MDHVSFIDQDKLRAWMSAETKLQVSDHALAAASNSIYCVMQFHMDAARRAVRDEVMMQVATGTFEELPQLEAWHFSTAFYDT